MSSIGVTSSASTCTGVYIDGVVLDEDPARVGIWFSGRFVLPLVSNGELLASLSRDDGEAVVPYLHLSKQLYTGLVRQAKPVMTITTRLTYGFVKESIDDHYGKHTRRQWGVLKMVVHFLR